MKGVSKFFYLKLALNNLKKNTQTYRAYLWTCIGTISMFFVMHAISMHSDLTKLSGGEQLKILLSFGVVVIAIFSTIFLLYSNSFLIKRRKKEFGLFNILGMEKRHLAKIIFWETIFTATISLTVGIIIGLALSKLMFLVLLKLVGFGVPLAFEISTKSITWTFTLFSIIFALSYLYNLAQISLTKPIELLKGEQMGEREPKTKWFLILLGVLSLGAGYYLAFTIDSPLEALNMFFIAVLLVMVGTYCLFTAGTIGVLKLLRHRKSFYYQPKNFTAISGLLFRMKQNAVGLANICILSSAVLVTLSTTISLYVGVEDQLRSQYPREIEVKHYDLDDHKEVERVRNHVLAVLNEHNVKPSNIVDYVSLSMVVSQEESTFQTGPEYLRDLKKSSGYLIVLTLADYEQMVGESLSLNKNEVFVLSQKDYPYDNLIVFEQDFTVKEYENPLVPSPPGQSMLQHGDYIFMVVSDLEIFQSLAKARSFVYAENDATFNHYLGFDLLSSEQLENEIQQAILAGFKPFAGQVSSRAGVRESFYALNGGLFFVGLFLGTLFIMGTVLIIYYKQITEGYADQQRFAIMQKVGMDQQAVKKTIRSQILMVFFLPLITAGIHVLMAFKMISKLLGIFNLTKISLFAWCSLGVFIVFGLCYGLVYALTARIYYRIVRI